MNRNLRQIFPQIQFSVLFSGAVRLLAVEGDQNEPLFTSGSPGVFFIWKLEIFTHLSMNRMGSRQAIEHLFIIPIKDTEILFSAKGKISWGWQEIHLFFFHRICNISFMMLKSFVGNQSIWHCKMSHLKSTAFSPDQGYYKSWILPFISTSVCMYFTLVLQSLISFRILALT